LAASRLGGGFFLLVCSAAWPQPQSFSLDENPRARGLDSSIILTYQSPPAFRKEISMAVTEIILKENVPGLGAEADIVSVRRGYARNFLIPTGKAYEVTPSNLKRLNLLKAKRAEREATELNEAEELAGKISKLKLEFVLETGETGKAFGSVTAKDIEDKLRSEANIELDRHRIQLDRPIKESGEQEVPVRLHAMVTTTLKLDIKVHAAGSAKTEEDATDAKPRPKRKTRSAG
jgi:large subunit ribosomal protein L9